jgi:hypothetical protein
MSGAALSREEEAELYVLLKPREAELEGVLADLLLRIEKSLFERLTIAEIESLIARFPAER